MEPEMINGLIRKRNRELIKKYPLDAAYNSKSHLWKLGRRSGLVSDELYMAAEKYYGIMWHYTGD